MSQERISAGGAGGNRGVLRGISGEGRPSVCGEEGNHPGTGEIAVEAAEKDIITQVYLSMCV